MAVVELSKTNEAEQVQGQLSMPVEVPNWLTKEEVEQSHDSAFADSAAPPSIIVVQGNAKREIAEKFDAGAVIAMPLEFEIAGKGQEFDFVPLTMWSLYMGWTPRARKQGVPPFVEVSRDPFSLAARKARAFIKERHAEYDVEVNWRETLCFLIYVLNSELKIPAVMMFGSTGYKAGQTLSLLVTSRQKFVPAYAQIWTAKSELKSNEHGTWYTLSCGAPEGRPTVLQDRELGMSLKSLAAGMREKMKTEFAAHLRDGDIAGADDPASSATAEF